MAKKKASAKAPKKAAKAKPTAKAKKASPVKAKAKPAAKKVKAAAPKKAAPKAAPKKEVHCAVMKDNKVNVADATKKKMYSDHKGKRYFFCSLQCVAHFDDGGQAEFP